MAKVRAFSKGYFGGVIREIGDTFEVPDDIWDDPKRRPKWVKPAAFGGKGDHDGDGKVGGSVPKAGKVESSKPAGDDKSAVVVPADWQSMKAAERKGLAAKISGEKAPNVEEADKIIAAFIEASKPEPFADAPAPETANNGGNGVQEALGSTQPDWVEPGTSSPKLVAD